MKMAWQAQAGTGRTRFLTVRGGYHGDTFSPMSVCDPEGGMHSMYAGIVPEHVFAPLRRRPTTPTSTHWAGGRRPTSSSSTPTSSPRSSSSRCCRAPAGCGRGRPRCVDHLSRAGPRARRPGDPRRDRDRLLAHRQRARRQDRLEERADIVCVGKALTGGYLTLAATLCTAEVAQRVSDSPAGAMMHGPTFMGEPARLRGRQRQPRPARRPTTTPRTSPASRTGCGVASPRRGPRRASSTCGRSAPSAWSQLDRPVDVRQGDRAPPSTRGVWVRPFRNLVYTMPPYVTSDEDLDLITAAIVRRWWAR